MGQYLEETRQRLQRAEDLIFIGAALEELQYGHGQLHSNVIEYLRSKFINWEKLLEKFYILTTVFTSLIAML